MDRKSKIESPEHQTVFCKEVFKMIFHKNCVICKKSISIGPRGFEDKFMERDPAAETKLNRLFYRLGWTKGWYTGDLRTKTFGEIKNADQKPDWKGTEAAAATAVQIEITSNLEDEPPKPKTIVMNFTKGRRRRQSSRYRHLENS